MSRIGSTINSFEQFLLTQLARSNQAINQSSYRLTTGRRINFPSDNPSAFLQITSFENQLSLLQNLHANVDVAVNIGASAQTTLDQLRTQLNTIRETLVEDEDNTLTANEKNTNQAAIDAALDAIRGLARTSINGKRFLDGSVDYTYSGKDPSQIRSMDVFSLTDDTVISGSVASTATQTTRRYTGAAGAINSGNATFTLQGKRGSTTISVTNGESLTAVRDRINLDSHLTGVTASVTGNQLNFATVDYGDAATMAITVTSGTFSTSSTNTGTDAVVTINGSAISSANIDGNRVTYIAEGVHVAVEFVAGFTGAFSSVTISDDQVARFALSTRSSERIKLALPGVFPETLGGVSGVLSSLESGGSLAGLGTNSAQAIRVVDEALAQLSTIEGRVNAFADISVASADELLTSLEANVEDSLDSLNSVDEDAEELVRSRYMALSDNVVTAIAIMQQQQSSMISLLRQMAGLD